MQLPPVHWIGSDAIRIQVRMILRMVRSTLHTIGKYGIPLGNRLDSFTLCAFPRSQ